MSYIIKQLADVTDRFRQQFPYPDLPAVQEALNAGKEQVVDRYP
jgi:hypothetical protein